MIDELRKFSKGQKFIDFQKKIIQTKLDILGVSTADVRKMAKTAADDFRNSPQFYEEVLLEGFVIAKIKDFETATKRLEKFFDKIDNWAVVDLVCPVCKCFSSDERSYAYFVSLLTGKEFVCRFGLVGLKNYFTNERFLETVIEDINRVNCGKYYVDMALAWLLSELIIKNQQNAKEIVQKITKNGHFNKMVIDKTRQKVIDSYRANEKTKELIRKLRYE